MLGRVTQRWLLALARASLEAAVFRRADEPRGRPEDPALTVPSRVFVSWHMGERLVGCLGTLEPRSSLEAAVRHFAVEAGINDPRTRPAQPAELPHLHCEISVLSEPRLLPQVGMEAIERVIVPRRDGVILTIAARRAVFLPVVWDKLDTPQAFLAALSKKAGSDVSRHGRDARASIFTTETFEDNPRQ